MLEVVYPMKRKSWESKNESASADSIGVSSSSSGPNPKDRRQQHDGRSRDGKVLGNSNLVEGELFRSTVSFSAGRRKRQCFNPGKGVMPSNTRSRAENVCVSERRGSVECLAANHEERTGRKDMQPLLTSLNTNRRRMEALLGELREARTRMLQWMREEMLSMLHEVDAAPRASIRFSGEISGQKMGLDEQVLQLDSALTRSPSVSLLGARFGGESNMRSELGLCGRSSEGVTKGALESGVESNDGSGGLESCDQNSVPGDSTLRTHDPGNVGEVTDTHKQTLVSDQRTLVALARQKSADRDTGVLACGGRFGNNKVDTGQFSVASVDYRRHALGGFESQDEQGCIDFSLQNDICRNHGEHDFQGQSDICGDLGFGPDSVNNGALGYGGSSDGGSLIYFGLHCSNQIGGSSSLNNTTVENHQAMPYRVSNEDKTPDFMGLQSHSEPVELQNAGSLSMVWNMMQQGGRNLGQRGCDSGEPSFKYDGIAKSRVGDCVSTMGTGITFGNTSGLFRSATSQNAVSVPIRSASHCFSSVDLAALITMQNQMAMQSPSTLQNFLDLNVGVGINKQMFPSAYLQESEVTISPNLSVAHKRSSGLHSLDMLELST